MENLNKEINEVGFLNEMKFDNNGSYGSFKSHFEGTKHIVFASQNDAKKWKPGFFNNSSDLRKVEFPLNDHTELIMIGVVSKGGLHDPDADRSYIRYAKIFYLNDSVEAKQRWAEWEEKHLAKRKKLFEKWNKNSRIKRELKSFYL